MKSNPKISSETKSEPNSSARVVPKRSAELGASPSLLSAVGNLVVQRMCNERDHSKLNALPAGNLSIQAKLKIGAANDPYEKEADSVADRVMRTSDNTPLTRAQISTSPKPFVEENVQRKCTQCDLEEELVQKKSNGTANSNNTGSVQNVVSSPGVGSPLSDSIRSRVEPVLGSDLSSVRVHTSSRSQQAANDINARAFTNKNNIHLASGQSENNLRLLAHELTHVVQQGSSGDIIQRWPEDGQVLTALAGFQSGEISLEAGESVEVIDWNVSDGVARVQLLAPFLHAYEPFNIPQAFLASSGGTQTEQTPTVPRPPGLPLDGGYSLTEVSNPPEFLNNLPEGQLMSADEIGSINAGAAPVSITWSSASPVMQGSELLGSGSGAALFNSARSLATTGFASAGDNAIGMVFFPQHGTPGHTGIPQSRLTWGHTAQYARVDGQIRILRSYGPNSLLETLANYRGVKTGNVGVPASIFDGGYTPGRGVPMWTHTGARSIEYPVTRAIAEATARGMPDLGPVSGGPLNGQYTGVGATRGLSCGANCVMWAVPNSEAAMGGRFGPLVEGSPTSVSALGEGRAPGRGVNVGSQGRMYGWASEMMPGPTQTAQSILGVDNRTGARVVATLIRDADGNVVRTVVNGLPDAATAAPTLGEMSRGMRYLRWGGRVFFVAGLLTVPAEIALAEEGNRTRTAVGAVSGFAGGFAAGALLGLACGPGAPVCMIVTGLVGGIAGGYVSRAGAESIYDNAPRIASEVIESVRWGVKNDPAVFVLPFMPATRNYARRGSAFPRVRSPLDVMRQR